MAISYSQAVQARSKYSGWMLIWAAAVLFISVILGVGLYRILFHPLAGVPGPFFAKITRLWQMWRYYQGRWHDDVLWLHEKYGPVVRIAPDEVAFVDANAMKQLYSYAKTAPKTDWYHVWNPSTKKSKSFFAETDIREHARRRRQVAQAYAMSSVLGAERYIQNIADLNWERFSHMADQGTSIDLNWERFSHMADQGTSIDLNWWTTAFAYDVVGELGFGEPFGFVADGKDERGIMDSVLSSFQYMGNLGYVPWQAFWIRTRVFKFLCTFIFGDRVNSYPRFLAQVDQRILERRARGSAERQDMLQQFFEAKTDQGLPLPHEDVVSEAANILGAGADTTSIGIKAVLGDLILRPQAYQRLREEIDAYYKTHGLDTAITYNQCQELPYLQAVVKESTRLHPSIIFQLPRYSPPEGITIHNHFIPGGMSVSMSPRSMNRNKAVFGPDANDWWPERWLLETGDKERIKNMDNFLATFGHGSRTCVGKNIALVEINKYVAQFVRQFDVKIVNRERPWKLYTVWFCIQQEMWVRLYHRRREIIR